LLSQDQLRDELAELEQVELNEQLMKADHVPVHIPPGASRVDEGESSFLYSFHILMIATATRRPEIAEDDEDAQLRQLQAELAM
jgi:charged multivesicular body protein 4